MHHGRKGAVEPLLPEYPHGYTNKKRHDHVQNKLEVQNQNKLVAE